MLQVRDAFAVLNEKVEGKSADLLMKPDHKPADILNIMDITMRRLVKVAKKMPAFNDLSADTKFALLKGKNCPIYLFIFSYYKGLFEFTDPVECFET
jgi:hypothetical protein